MLALEVKKQNRASENLSDLSEVTWKCLEGSSPEPCLQIPVWYSFQILKCLPEPLRLLSIRYCYQQLAFFPHGEIDTITMENEFSASFLKNHKFCKCFVFLIPKVGIVQPDGCGLLKGGSSSNLGLECRIMREVGQRMLQLRRTQEGTYFTQISIVFLKIFRG